MTGPDMLRVEGESEPRDGCESLNSSFCALKKERDSDVTREASLEGCNCLSFKMEDGHELKNVGRPPKLEKVRKQVLP